MIALQNNPISVMTIISLSAILIPFRVPGTRLPPVPDDVAVEFVVQWGHLVNNGFSPTYFPMINFVIGESRVFYYQIAEIVPNICEKADNRGYDQTCSNDRINQIKNACKFVEDTVAEFLVHWGSNFRDNPLELSHYGIGGSVVLVYGQVKEIAPGVCSKRAHSENAEGAMIQRACIFIEQNAVWFLQAIGSKRAHEVRKATRRTRLTWNDNHPVSYIHVKTILPTVCIKAINGFSQEIDIDKPALINKACELFRKKAKEMLVVIGRVWNEEKPIEAKNEDVALYVTKTAFFPIYQAKPFVDEICKMVERNDVQWLNVFAIITGTDDEARNDIKFKKLVKPAQLPVKPAPRERPIMLYRWRVGMNGIHTHLSIAMV